MICGALIGAFHGWLIAYREHPGLYRHAWAACWSGAASAFLVARGETISPVDPTFALLGGGPYGAIGSTGSWIVGILGLRRHSSALHRQRPRASG